MSRKLFGIASLICISIFRIGFGTDLPPRPSDMPGAGGNYPMWTGTSYMDSSRSTGADKLHAIGITGKGVSVAIMDSPYDTSNPYIAGNIIAAASYGTTRVGNGFTAFPGINTTGAPILVNADGSLLYGANGLAAVTLPSSQVVDVGDDTYGFAHGTHVAGTVVGMAPDAGLVLLNSAGYYNSGSGPELVSLLDTNYMLQYAASIAQQYNIVAINGSYSQRGSYWNAESSQLADEMRPETAAALAALRAAGVLPIFSAGNQGANNYLPTPPANTDAIAIGALHPYGVPTSFTNLNAKVVLLAPGQDILSSVPMWTIGADGGLGLMDGTSMAAPHVTGAIALLTSGMRKATPDEIYQALIDSADRVVYDDNSLITIGSVTVPLGVARAFVAAMSGAPADALVYLDYRFLRVDKAYMLLTQLRTQRQAGIVEDMGSPYYPMLDGYADLLGSGLSRETSEIFQLLDELSPAELARVARQMSPALQVAATKSAHLAFVDSVHGSVERRMASNRLARKTSYGGTVFVDCNSENIDPDASFCRTDAWGQVFGSWYHQSEKDWDASRSGDTYGAMAGLELVRGDITGGAFLGVARNKLTGEGKSTGDWGFAGLYGEYAREGWYGDLSASIGTGDYDLQRTVYIPGVVFPGATPGDEVVIDAVNRSPKASTNAIELTAQVLGGYDLLNLEGWTFGPELEGTLSYIRFQDYREEGGGSLGLAVDARRTVYLEGGVNLAVSRSLNLGGKGLTASLKAGARYGKTMNDEISGSFIDGGSQFRINPKNSGNFWFVPEASMVWRVTNRVGIDLAYTGRIGSGIWNHSGQVGVTVDW